ncbi:MAG TPA: ABC transporter ATP-binding protein [Candidatus Eremiobacteraeota bacterium]|nr:ABC transporter ATP-binding protein [Candidatus Eremiobacteraeota bacterium]
MKGITKRFPGLVANNKVDFDVKVGEIHALLGENGAGKSTLMSILSGFYQPDEGEIFINGQKVRIKSPRESIELGIGMVHQHFMLVETHTVTENIILGLREQSLFTSVKKGSKVLSHNLLFSVLMLFPHIKKLDITKFNKEITDLGELYGLPVDPEARIWQLTVGEQQRVEILKVLYRGAKILIMDEPTAVLTPQETKELFKTLKKMTAQGHSIIFISHKLDEVMAISDRITVLRAGTLEGTVSTDSIDKRGLARMMVGRDIITLLDKPAVTEEKKEILQVNNLKAFNDKGMEALKGVSFSIYSGEILGIAGVAGNGQNELSEVLAGLRRAVSGKILLCGENITGTSVRERIDRGVSYIPADRLGVGLVPNLDAKDNAILKGYRKPPVSEGPFLSNSAMEKLVNKMIEDYEIKIADKSFPVRLLSGGNLQKLLLARELLGEPGLIIAVYPVRGLDIGAAEFVHKVLLKQRERGASILLISEDLDELLTMSDRIAVIYEGKIMSILLIEDANKESIGLMMAGTEVVTEEILKE